MGEETRHTSCKTVKFSKDNPVIEISSKQSQVQTQNITPPVKPKEIKKK